MCQSLFFNEVKKETLLRVFSCEFCEIFINAFLRTPRYDCIWIEYKYNNTKMIQINIKRNYTLPHFIRFNKQILLFIAVGDDIQKQLFAYVLQNNCSQKLAIFADIHLRWNNFIKKMAQHRCFSMNIGKFLRTTFFRTTTMAVSGHLHYFLILL